MQPSHRGFHQKFSSDIAQLFTIRGHPSLCLKSDVYNGYKHFLGKRKKEALSIYQFAQLPKLEVSARSAGSYVIDFLDLNKMLESYKLELEL